MVLPKLKRRLNEKNTLNDHDSIHGHRNLNDTERSAIARHRNFNAPKICKITVANQNSPKTRPKCAKNGVEMQRSSDSKDIHTWSTVGVSIAKLFLASAWLGAKLPDVTSSRNWLRRVHCIKLWFSWAAMSFLYSFYACATDRERQKNRC